MRKSGGSHTFEAYTYFGPDAAAKIALAEKISTRPATDFATWAQADMPPPA